MHTALNETDAKTLEASLLVIEDAGPKTGGSSCHPDAHARIHRGDSAAARA